MQVKIGSKGIRYDQRIFGPEPILEILGDHLGLIRKSQALELSEQVAAVMHPACAPWLSAPNGFQPEVQRTMSAFSISKASGRIRGSVMVNLFRYRDDMTLRTAFRA